MIRAFALLILLTSPAAAQTCAAALERIRAAWSTATATELAQLQRTEVDVACTGAEGADSARRVALRHALEAARLTDPGARIAMLRAGIAISGEPWQLQEMLGDALQATNNHALAAQHYQLALNALHHLPPTAAEPPREHVERLLRKAQQARMLAPQLVTLPTTRDGRPGGLGLRSVRSIVVESVAQPLHFITDSAELTPLGQQAFRQLQELLREEGNPVITLIGHTDERGSHTYNDSLSLRRAQRIAEMLVAGGYAPDRIRAEGRGKRQPFPVTQVQDVRYTDDQRWQLDRRVELRR
jgi:outer membrane protein OmpA-like peptidoglycan-associated protein